MNDLIIWCNSNAGFLMAVLTAVYVLATVAIVLISMRANRISQANIEALSKLEEERIRPFVEVEMENDIQFITFKVANNGQTAAYDISFEIDRPLKLLLKGKDAENIGLIEHGIGTLCAKSSKTALIGTFSRFREEYPHMDFTGKVFYNSFKGKSYETPINVNLQHLRNSVSVHKKTIHDVAKELEKIRKEINYIGTRFHKPHVIVEDIEHKRAADKKMIEDIERRKKDKD